MNTKTHGIRASSLAPGGKVKATTFCGRTGTKDRGISIQYSHTNGFAFDAVEVDPRFNGRPHLVTCEQCLRLAA